jgi:DNA processing protein
VLKSSGCGAPESAIWRPIRTATERVHALRRIGMRLVEPWPTGVTSAVIRLARALGRPLLAVPGPVTSDGSRFAHQLVRDGAARLARDARDVLTDLSASAGGGR